MTDAPARSVARGRELWLFEVVLVLFFAGLLTTALYPGLAPWNRVTGGLLAALAISYWSQRGGGIPAEVALFAVFCTWGGLTGLALAGDPSLAMAYTKLIAQELILMFAVVEYVRKRRGGAIIAFLLLLIPLCNWLYARSTGELADAQMVGQRHRLASFAGGQNYLGTLSLYGLFGLAYFLWNRRKQGLVLWPLLGLSIAGTTLVLSGSRSRILSAVVFALTWVSLAYWRGKAAKLRPILAVLTVAVILYLAGQSVMEKTLAGERFRTALRDPRFSTGRYELYLDGWRMFLQAPIQGVGLGNFVLQARGGQYAHSDFMEVLATTGMVGFVLYFSIYLLLWRRMRRLLKMRLDATSRYDVGLYQAITITMLTVGLSTPLFLEPVSMCILGMMIGHLRAIEEDTKHALPARYPQFARHHGG